MGVRVPSGVPFIGRFRSTSSAPKSFLFPEPPTTPPKIHRFRSNFGEGTEPVGHATGMSFVALLLAYHLLVDFGVLLVLRNLFYFWSYQQRRQKFIAFARIFGKGQSQPDMPPAYPLWLYFWRTSGGSKVSPMDWINAVERMVLQRFLLSKCQSFPITFHLIP